MVVEYACLPFDKVEVDVPKPVEFRLFDLPHSLFSFKYRYVFSSSLVLDYIMGHWGCSQASNNTHHVLLRADQVWSFIQFSSVPFHNRWFSPTKRSVTTWGLALFVCFCVARYEVRSPSLSAPRKALQWIRIRPIEGVSYRKKNT